MAQPDPLNPSTPTPAPERPIERVPPPAPPPVWAQRLMLGFHVAISLWAGILVLLLPWTRLWAENPLISSWPALQSLLDLNFVRGMISGVGVLDIWIGISDAVHYRDLR